MDDSTELDHVLRRLREHLPELTTRYRVHSLGVFGSYVRGNQRRDSDIDVLVTFEQIPGLLKFIELESYLTDMLGLQVDLVMQEALKPAIGEHILAEVVPV